MQILDIENAIQKAIELKKENKKIVVAGGCFDIIHLGHVRFLEQAKKNGDYLFILLESDKSVRRIKGEDRPLNTQNERAEVLTSIKYVDFVVPLGEFKTDEEYDALIQSLSPDVIATTDNDPNLHHKQRQAEKTNSRIEFVLSRLDKSTSEAAEALKNESL